jgi:CheY-like chemotaxis protein
MQGCGLLPLTRQLVHLLGGKIEALPLPDSGTTFSILIPGEPAEQKTQMLIFPPRSTESERNDRQDGSCRCIGRILLVEDEESNRTVLTLLLENLGLDVTAVPSGQAALTAAGQNDFDAVLMDLQLPDTSGLEVAQRLRDQGLQTPMIALSAGTQEEEQNRRIETLFDAFLAKPVEGAQLAEVLQPLLPTMRNVEPYQQTADKHLALSK